MAPSSSRAEAPITAWSTLNWVMKSTAASPTMPPSLFLSTPPARITSILGRGIRMVATWMLLVITSNPS